MRILVIGGTKFVGRALVEAALSAGHQITLFNRGKSNPEFLKNIVLKHVVSKNTANNIEILTGDRDGGLSALEGKSWDIAIDTCGYVPRVVRQSVELLQNSVERYLFISTLSVYTGAPDATGALGEIAEDSELQTLKDETTEIIDAETYGGLKVLCENEVEKCFAGRSLHIRPGYIVGPHDPTDRFTYWALKATQAGDALTPNPPNRQMQFVDTRDLGDWIIHCCENNFKGFYNAVGPKSPISMQDLLSSCTKVAKEKNGDAADFIWVDEKFLEDNEAQFGYELPLCSGPSDDPADLAIFDSSKALSQGLKIRPLEETIADTIDWANSLPADHESRAGLTKEKEAKLLAAWNQSKSN